MQEHDVLQLIELAVRPLRDKIDQLQKQNEQLRIQISAVSSNNHGQGSARLRSNSREGEGGRRREEVRDVRTPSVEKRDKKPIWNYGRNSGKQENVVYKLNNTAPPPVDKNKYNKVPPKISTRGDSKQKVNCKAPASPTLVIGNNGVNKPNGVNGANSNGNNQKQEVKYLSFEKPNGSGPRIKGGQKFSESGSDKDKKQSQPASIKQSGINKYDINPQSNSQDISEHNNSQLLPEEVADQS